MESKTVKTAQTVTTRGIQMDKRKLQTQKIADKIGRTSAHNNDSETKNSALLRKPKTNTDNEKDSTRANTEKMNGETRFPHSSSLYLLSKPTDSYVPGTGENLQEEILLTQQIMVTIQTMALLIPTLS